MMFFFYQKINVLWNHTYTKEQYVNLFMNLDVVNIFNVDNTIDTAQVLLREAGFKYGYYGFDQNINDLLTWSFKNAFKNVSGFECRDFNTYANNYSAYSVISHLLESLMFRVMSQMHGQLLGSFTNFNIVLTYERLYVISY